VIVQSIGVKIFMHPASAAFTSGKVFAVYALFNLGAWWATVSARQAMGMPVLPAWDFCWFVLGTGWANSRSGWGEISFGFCAAISPMGVRELAEFSVTDGVWNAFAVQFMAALLLGIWLRVVVAKAGKLPSIPPTPTPMCLCCLVMNVVSW
jgi:hypothetical protein